MNEVEFLDLWKKVHATFGLDGKSNARLDAFNCCIERVRPIPAKSRDYILTQFQNLDRLPANIGRAVTDFYRAWQRNQCAEKQKQHTLFKRKGCERCIDGYIYAARKNAAGGEYVYPFTCGYCGQGNETFPGMTCEELVAAGYIIRMPRQKAT